MIRINLLGAHKVLKKVKKDRDWQFKGIILAYILFLGAVFFGYWTLNSHIQSLKEEKETLERKTRAAAALQREIKELKQKKELSQARLAIFQNLEKERHGPVQLMEFLSQALPVDQLWLTSVKESGSEIRIDGMTLSNDILAEYMKHLESSLLFQQVDLIQSTQALFMDLRVKQFSLIAWTKAPPPPAPPVEKK